VGFLLESALVAHFQARLVNLTGLMYGGRSVFLFLAKEREEDGF
jgi:hypothetical protein